MAHNAPMGRTDSPRARVRQEAFASQTIRVDSNLEEVTSARDTEIPACRRRCRGVPCSSTSMRTHMPAGTGIIAQTTGAQGDKNSVAAVMQWNYAGSELSRCKPDERAALQSQVITTRASHAHLRRRTSPRSGYLGNHGDIVGAGPGRGEYGVSALPEARPLADVHPLAQDEIGP